MVTAKPVGKKKECTIIFAPTVVAPIQLEGIAVPFHDFAFIRRNGALRLSFSKSVCFLLDRQVGALGIFIGPRDCAEGYAVQRLRGIRTVV